MDTNRIDVLVVGLGPAGACAAANAAARGCTVIAIDRKRTAGVPVQCAEFVPKMVGIDVGELNRSVCQTIDAMVTYVETDPADVHDDFPGAMLDRARFDAALVENAKGSGACCEFGVSVQSISSHGEVTLSDSRALRPSVIVGADGPHSIVGRAIGQVNRELVETRQITVPLLRAHQATDIFLSADIPGGYGWMFPKGELAHVGAGVNPSQRAHLKRIVADLHAMLMSQRRVGAEIVSLTGGAIPVGGMLKAFGTVGNAAVLLAGDAAGLTNPVTGAGIAAAVHSGTLAGRAAAAYVHGDTTALEGYQEELESVFRVALDRALARRKALAGAGGRPSKSALRRSWIAYPEYWVLQQDSQTWSVRP